MSEIFLWAGLNWEGFAEDEANGGGVNPAVNPLPFEDAQVFRPLIEEPGYWTGCADVTIPRENRAITIPRERRTFRVR